jgi:hypothetical protein
VTSEWIGPTSSRRRADCLKGGLSLQELAWLLLDDAVLALYTVGVKASQFFRDYRQRRILRRYAILPECDA